MRARSKSPKPADLALVIHEMLNHLDALRLHLEDLAATLTPPKPRRKPSAKHPTPPPASPRPRPRALQ